jgi:4-aminobutyrate aminotransferase/(S)-3-amino-2-methylpropionate transaminase
MDAPTPGGLGGTYGGNAAACAAALAVMDLFEEQDLLAQGEQLAAQLREGLLALQKRYPRIGDVRGLGFMQAIEIVAPDSRHSPDAALAQKIIDEARNAGLLVIKCGIYRNVVRFLAPLVTTPAQLAEALQMLDKALAAAGA